MSTAYQKHSITGLSATSAIVALCIIFSSCVGTGKSAQLEHSDPDRITKIDIPTLIAKRHNLYYAGDTANMVPFRSRAISQQPERYKQLSKKLEDDIPHKSVITFRELQNMIVQQKYPHNLTDEQYAMLLITATAYQTPKGMQTINLLSRLDTWFAIDNHRDGLGALEEELNVIMLELKGDYRKKNKTIDYDYTHPANLEKASQLFLFNFYHEFAHLLQLLDGSLQMRNRLPEHESKIFTLLLQAQADVYAQEMMRQHIAYLNGNDLLQTSDSHTLYEDFIGFIREHKEDNAEYRNMFSQTHSKYIPPEHIKHFRSLGGEGILDIGIPHTQNGHDIYKMFFPEEAQKNPNMRGTFSSGRSIDY